MKQLSNLMLAVGFGLGLALPTIGSFCHAPKNRTVNENRPLAGLPKLQLDAGTLRVYFDQMQHWHDDHFGFRESLIAFDLAAKRALFPEELGPKVLAGRDGWLYLRRDRYIDLVDDYLGMTTFSQDMLKDRQTGLEAQRDRLAALGIKFLFVIAPEKASVYPEHAPAWLKPPASTKTDQFVEYMHAHSTVDVLDLRPALRQARQRAEVYYVTDPHWNAMGAYIACEAIVSNLSGQVPGLAPLGLEEFAIQRQPCTGGNLAGMAGEPDLVEINQYIFAPGPNLPGLEITTPDTNQIRLQAIWRLPVPVKDYVVTNPRRTGTVIVFGDSFAVDLAPFLGFHFAKVICLQTSVDLNAVKDAHAEVVIFEKAERYLP